MPLWQMIAETLCECDGKDWTSLPQIESERYCRIALVIEQRIRDQIAEKYDTDMMEF